MLAASEGHVQVVSYLLVSGANPNVLAQVSEYAFTDSCMYRYKLLDISPGENFHLFHLSWQGVKI